MTERKRRRHPGGRPDGTRPTKPRAGWWSRAFEKLAWFDHSRPRWQRALIFATGWSILGATLLTILVGCEVIATRGKPLEDVTVIAVEKKMDLSECSRYRHVQLHYWLVTYRSANPPVDLPEDFTIAECSDSEVGLNLQAVRVRHGEHVRTYINPEQDAEWIPQATFIALLATFPLLYLGYFAYSAVAARLGPSCHRLLARLPWKR